MVYKKELIIFYYKSLLKKEFLVIVTIVGEKDYQIRGPNIVNNISFDEGSDDSPRGDRKKRVCDVWGGDCAVIIILNKNEFYCFFV